MKKNKFTLFSLHNIKTWPLILTCIFFLCINCIIVVNSITKTIKRDFDEQLDVLSHESSQIIASNYSILEGITHNILSHKQLMLYSYNILLMVCMLYWP